MSEGVVGLILLIVAFLGLQCWWISRIVLFNPRGRREVFRSTSLEKQRRHLESSYERF